MKPPPSPSSAAALPGSERTDPDRIRPHAVQSGDIRAAGETFSHRPERRRSAVTNAARPFKKGVPEPGSPTQYALGPMPDFLHHPDDETLRQLVDALTDSGQAVSIYDADDHLRYANKTYCDLFLQGYDGPFTF